MLTTLILFVGSMLVWWSALWWALPVSWQHISPSAILLLHTLPPLLFASAIKAWGWLKAKKIKQAEEAQAAQAAVEAQAQLQQADTAHQAALQERQISAICRGVWAATLADSPPEWLEQQPEGCAWQTFCADALKKAELSASLTPALTAVLDTTYGAAPAAAWLPLYIEPLPGLTGEEQLHWIKRLQLAAVAQFEPLAHPLCRFMPGQGTLGDRVLQLFRQDPELPGLMVLSLDAPWVVQAVDEADAFAPSAPRPIAASAAIVAMLWMRPDLQAPVEVESAPDTIDPYQPYWERTPPVHHQAWGGVPSEVQQALLRLPALASLSRAAEAQGLHGGALALSKVMRPLLHDCMVNARLRAMPFRVEAEPEIVVSDPAWLVHNSGPIKTGGTRLAAIGSVLGSEQIDLNPIDQASNLPREWGDVGAAASAVLIAMAVYHSARLAAPVVLAQFDQQSVSLAIVRPTEEISR